MLNTLINILVFISGLSVGSFLNVCISRLPLHESIISPRSHCPQCKTPLPWHDNIPLISYLLLKGRCRACKAKISFIYFVVELTTAAMFVILFNHFGMSVKFLIYILLLCGLISSSFIDLKHRIIPDVITFSGMGIGLFLSFIYPPLQLTNSHKLSLFNSILGLLVGGGSIYLMGLLGKVVFRKEAMGAGDVTLLAMVGAFVGWRLALLSFFIAPFFGLGPGLILKIRKKAEIIPYGPYLSLATVVSILWGKKIINCLFGY